MDSIVCERTTPFWLSVRDNDSKPEADVQITVEFISLTVDCYSCYAAAGYDQNVWHDLPASGSASFTVNDDDDWTISATTMDDEALEPCVWIPGDERPGVFTIQKSGGPNSDRVYSIYVAFELTGNAVPGTDYYLATSPNGNDPNVLFPISYSNGKYTGGVSLAANVDSVTIYVVPIQDGIFETDEVLELTVTDAYAVKGYSFDFNGSDKEVEILQAPEFISDADKEAPPPAPEPERGMQAGYSEYGEHTIIEPFSQKPRRGIYAPISTAGFFGIMLIMLVPILNILLLILWAAGCCTKIAKRSFARAALVFISFALVVILVFAVFGEQIVTAADSLLRGWGIYTGAPLTEVFSNIGLSRP